MSRRVGHRRSVCALNAGDFTNERPVVFVNHHDAILAADEQPMIRRIGDDVVPTAVPAERIGVRDAIGRRLRKKRRSG